MKLKGVQEKRPAQRPPAPKRQQNIIIRIADIVIDDLKSLIRRDRKSVEDKMTYREFMESHFK